MPVRLNHLANDSRTFTMPVGDDTLTITYRPSAITPAAEDALRETASNRGGGTAVMELLQKAVIAWDLLGADDQPVPLTNEGMRNIPTTFLTQVLNALVTDTRPNAPKGGTSVAG